MVGRVSAYLRQNVLGLIAIFLALTAGAYAVKKAPKNSVVSKSIKDGQVKEPELGAAAVTADKLGFDTATQAELDATKAGLSAPGTINDAANPLEWSRLKGVPSGIADGDDGRFGLAATDNSGNTTASVANLSILSINSPGPVVLNELTGAQSGQVVTLHQLQTGGAVTIFDNGSFVLTSNWTSTAGDTLTLARTADNFWVEVARSVN